MSTMPIKYAVPTGSARSRLLTALAARYTGCAVSGRVVWDGLDIHPASQTSGRFCYSIGKTRSIESGIYLVRRAHEETKAGSLLVGESTGQSVALFSLSTMVGFGSLMVARHYGIFSMGLLLTLAVGSVLLVSLTILPLLLHTSTPGVSERGRKTQEKTATASPTECATRKA